MFLIFFSFFFFLNKLFFTHSFLSRIVPELTNERKMSGVAKRSLFEQFDEVLEEDGKINKENPKKI